MTIRVLLCDDQALVRSGFRMILEAREDIEVVGEAEDGVQAIELAWRADPGRDPDGRADAERRRRRGDPAPRGGRRARRASSS